MLTVGLFTLLKILALGFLIFIHELGHYFAARWVGMRVEAFSIGFLRPIYSWEHKGTKWQICWLLFGGYVKIAGTDTPEGTDLYEIKDGFFGKRPIDRIIVSLAGPAANLIFAFVAFTALWAMGGLSKNYSEHSNVIGWVDPASELYVKGVRPGDEITAYNDNAYTSAKEHLEMPMTAGESITVYGNKVNHANGEKSPFEYTVKTYPHPIFGSKGIQTAGILASSNYIIYDKVNGKDNPLPTLSPLESSGIGYGDRIVWVDGETVFSSAQLKNILNDGRILATISRGDKTLLRRIPRVKVQELKLDQSYKDELTDWQYEAQLKGAKLQNLYMVPYNLTNDGVVEGPFKLIDEDDEKSAFPQNTYSEIDEPLQEGDRIIAIYGKKVQYSYQLLYLLQKRQALVIVERNSQQSPVNWLQADAEFEKQMDNESLAKIAASIGTGSLVKESGNYRLLAPVTPITKLDIEINQKGQEAVDTMLGKKQREIASLADPEQRAATQKIYDAELNEFVLGVPNVQDRKVQYNPGPFEMFQEVVQDIWRFLKALFSFNISFKWVAGPIGILQTSTSSAWGGVGSALDWLAFISINLGILNLLPIPVLDGGTIVLSFYEMITGHKMKPKTMEKLILPFALVLVGFFIFVTLNDINRLFNFF